MAAWALDAPLGRVSSGHTRCTSYVTLNVTVFLSYGCGGSEGGGKFVVVEGEEESIIVLFVASAKPCQKLIRAS